MQQDRVDKNLKQIMLDLRDMSYHSAAKHWEDFKGTVVWRDFETALLGAINNRRSMLEGIEGEFALAQLSNLQGEISMARTFLALPDAIIEELKMKGEDDDAGESNK